MHMYVKKKNEGISVSRLKVLTLQMSTDFDQIGKFLRSIERFAKYPDLLVQQFSRYLVEFTRF